MRTNGVTRLKRGGTSNKAGLKKCYSRDYAVDGFKWAENLARRASEGGDIDRVTMRAAEEIAQEQGYAEYSIQDRFYALREEACKRKADSVNDEDASVLLSDGETAVIPA